MGLKPKLSKETGPTRRPLPNIGLIEVVENASDFVKQTTPPNWVKGEVVERVLLPGGPQPLGPFTRERSPLYAVSVTNVYVSLLARMLPQGQTVELRVTSLLAAGPVNPTTALLERRCDFYRQTIQATGKTVFPNVIVGTGYSFNFEDARKQLSKAQKYPVLFEMLLENEAVGSLDAFFWGDHPPVIQPKIK